MEDFVLVKDLEKLRDNYKSFVFQRGRRADFIRTPFFENSFTIGLGEDWYFHSKTERLKLVAKEKGYDSIDDYQGSYWTLFRLLTLKSLANTDSYLMNVIDELQYRQFPLYFSRAEKLYGIVDEKGFIEGESSKNSDKLLASVFIGEIKPLIKERFKNDLEYFLDDILNYPEEYAIIALLREQLKRITDLCFKGLIISDVIRCYSIDSMDKGENLTIPEWHEVTGSYNHNKKQGIVRPLLPKSSKAHIDRLIRLVARNKTRSDLVPKFLNEYYRLKLINPTWMRADFINEIAITEVSTPTLYSWMNEFDELLSQFPNAQ